MTERWQDPLERAVDLAARRRWIDAAAKAGFEAGWNAALDEAATVADSFACGSCGMDGKSGEAIRKLRAFGEKADKSCE